MAELGDLYQDIILEHSKRPRNYRTLEAANRKAEGFNPLCGDHFTVYLEIGDGQIRDISFQGSGCAISKASASMMTQALKGKSTEEAEEVFQKFPPVGTGKNGAEPDDDRGNLGAVAGVSEYPVRVKCATLAWHALRAALEGEQ